MNIFKIELNSRSLGLRCRVKHLRVLGGYEHFDYSSQALVGTLKGDGWTAGAFVGWRFAPKNSAYPGWSQAVRRTVEHDFDLCNLGVPRSADDHFNFDESSGSVVRFLGSE
jgi:hypothetical protein